MAVDDSRAESFNADDDPITELQNYWALYGVSITQNTRKGVWSISHAGLELASVKIQKTRDETAKLIQQKCDFIASGRKMEDRPNQKRALGNSRESRPFVAPEYKRRRKSK